MAGGAIGGESGSRVVRVRCAVVILLMAAHAFGRCAREIAGGMAARAITDVVPQGERKEVVVNEIRRPAEAQWIMALHAVRGESRQHMIRALGGEVIRLVAIDAIIANPVERVVVVGNVTIHAAQVAMHPDQCESVLLVQFRYVVDQPAHRRMAPGTIVTHGHTMHIRVARNAIVRRGLTEDQ